MYAYRIGREHGQYLDLIWSFIQLGLLEMPGPFADEGRTSLNSVLLNAIDASISELGGYPDFVFLFIGGSEQHRLGLLNDPVPFDVVLPAEEELPISPNAIVLPYFQVKRLLLSYSDMKLCLVATLGDFFRCPVFQRQAPPPIESESHIRSYPGPAFQQLIAERGISPPSLRYKLWCIHSRNYEEVCKRKQINYLTVPPGTTCGGFLNPEYIGNDSIHANLAYGHALIKDMLRQIELLSVNVPPTSFQTASAGEIG